MPKPPPVTLEIISPFPGKGLGRKYLARDEIKDEANYIELGLLCRDNGGVSVKDATVIVETTDKDQDKKLVKTGNMTKVYVEEVCQCIFYYPFHYEFKKPGKHTILFTCNELSISVDLEAEEDTRP